MEFRRDVTSVIQIGEEKTRVEGYYHLDKTIVCDTDEIASGVVNKLDRLQKEDFNRIHIPKFDYYINRNAVRYRVEFIKGYPLGTVSKFKDIIYEDVVDRESDWTFDDFGASNFIVEHNTDKIFAVDFQSYNYIPNRDYRISKWEKLKKINFNILEDILINEKWTNPTRHPL